ncbi:MAG: hypothetical protein P0Y52_06930 [Candidatus Brevundimonas phytovorans]|nr:hypothetical protein [Brevundimonas sp.]WEK59267.1 MAG: hypothetical protein P0Y52_06930 [Brevundimonas sp.]
MEPWFRRRWYGWQPIHPTGYRIWLATAAIAVLGLAGMLVFAWINIWISAAIFIAFMIASFPLNAVIISRTEKA